MSIMSLLEVGSLQSIDVSGDLVLETGLCEDEVRDDDLEADLGQVLGFGELGSHVETEVEIIVHIGIAKADEEASSSENKELLEV